MGLVAGEASSIERWGPVCCGFNVSFPNGSSGHVTEIRLRDGGVELLVATPSSPARAVAAADIAVILPRARRIIIRRPSAAEDDAAGVETAGGIIRFSDRHSSRIAAPPEEAA